MKRPARRLVQPLGWVRPSGYSNAVVASGQLVFISGQVGWDPRSLAPRFPKGFAAQFDRALANLLEVLREAGGRPADLVRVTIYVLEKKEYLASLREVGEAWRRRIGRHFPAITLIQVAGLLERAARVEIEATAVL
jgi:enamine deaminase RidA (YjgF/YER057c/UK114 family)